MRILILPEIYNTDYLSANGTVADALEWIEAWAKIDPTTHVYLPLPPRTHVTWEQSDLPPEQDCTVIEKRRFMEETDYEFYMVDGWYREEQLMALKRLVEEQHAYFDIVIDQQLAGRYQIWRFLHETIDYRFSNVRPFELIDFMHDFRAEFKGHGERYYNSSEPTQEISQTLYADGIWVKSWADAQLMMETAKDRFSYSAINDMDQKLVRTNSPIDFTEFDESYNDRPQHVHIAGSSYAKKNQDMILDICELLYQRFDIETIVTSMKAVPNELSGVEWIDVHDHCPYDEYKRQLARGDIVLCCSHHETMGRTWFEQAASGQVLIAWDRPWLYDQIPDDYQLTCDKQKLAALAVWVVNNWDQAVEENKRMVKHVKQVRDPETNGQRLYDDMADRTRARQEKYDLKWDQDVLSESIAACSIETEHPDYEQSVYLDTLNETTAEFMDNGDAILDNRFYTLTDLVLALRTLGYQDLGNAGVPEFAK